MTVTKPCRNCGQLIDFDYKVNWWCDHKTNRRHNEPDLQLEQPNIVDIINQNTNDLSKQLIAITEDIGKLRKVTWENGQKLSDIQRKLA